MTNLNDFDRSLGDFLADGPNTAPEAPVIAALAHARTTPRRRDLLRAMRPDVMGRPRLSGGGFALRPGIALAAMALLAASIGVAVVGSRLGDPSVVQPGPSTPVSSPSPVPSLAFAREIPLIVAAGQPFTLKVTGTSGALIGAESGQPGDGAAVEFGTVQIASDPADPTVLVVTWTGGPCESGATMTVDEPLHRISILRQDCRGDSIALDRVVGLQFQGETDSAAWSGAIDLVPAVTDSGQPAVTEPPTASTPTTGGPREPLGSPAVPPVRAILVDENGNEVPVDVVDESGRLVSAAAGTPVDGVSIDAFDAANDAPAVVRLSWIGEPCDTIYRLTINAALSNLTLDAPQCHGDAIGVARSMILTFQDAVDAPSLSTTFHAGRGGVDMPTWTTAAPDAAGGLYRVTLQDPGYVVEALDGYFDPQLDSQMPGPGGHVFEEVDPSTVRLVWNGPSCATDLALLLDPIGETWTLWYAPCESSTTVLRMFDVAFTSPHGAHNMKFEARVGEPRG